MNPDLLALLPSLEALVTASNVTRAGRAMGISQARMSARLARLRALVGDPLLVPAARGRGMVPTPRALDLAGVSTQVLRTLDAAFEQAAFDPRTSTRTFHILANDNAATLAGVALVAAVRRAGAPGVRIAFRQFDEPTFAAQLEKGEADLAIGSLNQLSGSPALLSTTVIRDTFATAFAARDDTAGSMDLETFCRRDHVIVSASGGRFDGFVDDELARLGRKRHVAVSVQNYLVALELVMETYLIATLPRRLLATRTQRLEITTPPLDLAPFALAAAWHPRIQADPASVWLRATLSAARVNG